jgi:hypothetical protein
MKSNRGPRTVCYDTRVTRFLPAPIVPARRRFLARLGIASAAFGTLVVPAATAEAQAPSPAPRRHPIDDWMDTLPAAHRMMFDAVTSKGAEDIRHYASNVFTANKSGYDLESRDIGVIIILRHEATPYAFSDAMWAKYGNALAAELKLGNTPAANPAITGGEGLEALATLGAHFAACGMATRRYAGILARSSGGTTDAVFDELGKNLVRNGHLTPAGIVAVGRAQERGFTFGYAG